jgi:P27 family predicted phage terminase small subunit
MAGTSGRSGRRPKPTALKVAAGNPGKRALNTDAVDFELVTHIVPPEWLQGPGRELWETVAPMLCKQRVLQATDVQNLEIYCAAYGRFRAGELSIAVDGIVVAGAQGGVVKNPAATVVNEAVRQMNSYGALLGLDPSSRQRMHGPKKAGEANEFVDLLG